MNCLCGIRIVFLLFQKLIRVCQSEDDDVNNLPSVDHADFITSPISRMNGGYHVPPKPIPVPIKVSIPMHHSHYVDKVWHEEEEEETEEEVTHNCSRYNKFNHGHRRLLVWWTISVQETKINPKVHIASKCDLILILVGQDGLSSSCKSQKIAARTIWWELIYLCWHCCLSSLKVEIYWHNTIHAMNCGT